jgi:hypothetical protein
VYGTWPEGIAKPCPYYTAKVRRGQMPFYCVSVFRIEGYRAAALLTRGPTGWIDRPTRWLATEMVTVTVFDTRTVTVRVPLRATFVPGVRVRGGSRGRSSRGDADGVRRRLAGPQDVRSASASISTSISGSIRWLTSTMVVAGRMEPKTSPCARPTASQSRTMFVT